MQAFDQVLQRQTTVRATVLLVRVELGSRLAERRQEEIRVVTEATGTARNIDDLAVPLTFGDDRLRVVGVAHENEDADVVGAAVGLACEIGNQLLVIARIGLGLTGKACRVHTGRPAKGVYA